MMSFSGQVALQDAFLLIDSAASYYFVSSVFANTFGLKVKKDNITLVLGNGDEVPRMGTLKSMLKYNNIIVILLVLWPG